MPTIETKRGNFWIADHRREHSPITSILIHGAGGSHLSFPKELRRHKLINAVLVDLNGHGASEGAGHCSIADYALDLVALMDALEIEKAILMGHSMGGAIAQWQALQQPERVLALVLVGTGPRLPVNPALIHGIIAETESTIDNLVRWMWSKETAADLREESAQVIRGTPPFVIQNDFIACDNFDIRNRLCEIDIPTLIIAGENDMMTPTALSEELERGIEGSKLIVIPQAGHMMLLEQPTKVVEQLDAWLAHF